MERIGIGIEEFYEILGAVVALPLAFALLYSEVRPSRFLHTKHNIANTSSIAYYRQANWAAFLPIAVMVVALGITSYIAKLAGGKQTLWSQQTDKRIKLMVLS